MSVRGAEAGLKISAENIAAAEEKRRWRQRELPMRAIDEGKGFFLNTRNPCRRQSLISERPFHSKGRGPSDVSLRVARDALSMRVSD